MIANAAISPKGYTIGEDGQEIQFTGDHLSHFLLIQSIFPLILAARSPSFAPRIVAISSIAHMKGGVRFDDLLFDGGKEYSMLGGYANAKSANILFVKELGKRAAGEGVLAFAVHPGGGFISSLIRRSADFVVVKKLFGRTPTTRCPKRTRRRLVSTVVVVEHSLSTIIRRILERRWVHERTR